KITGVVGDSEATHQRQECGFGSGEVVTGDSQRKLLDGAQSGPRIEGDRLNDVGTGEPTACFTGAQGAVAVLLERDVLSSEPEEKYVAERHGQTKAEIHPFTTYSVGILQCPNTAEAASQTAAADE